MHLQLIRTSPAITLATYVHLLPEDLPDPDFLDGLTGSGSNEAPTRPTENCQDDCRGDRLMSVLL
jgi:hypothetical protein